ncbi:unnamed protein product [Cuscuta campestris]|uniref:Uncharacterized protein n=1 Tax=Cuscuta campestris TaxID=132261 RepID=A0A484LXQ4_9ASTE|nr:unnamed protein product [Cuscuta campestris]
MSHTSVVGMFIQDGTVVGTDSRLTGLINRTPFILRGNPALKLMRHKGFASAVSGWWNEGCVRIHAHIEEKSREYANRFPRRARVDVINRAVTWAVKIIRSLGNRKADCTLFEFSQFGCVFYHEKES